MAKLATEVYRGNIEDTRGELPGFEREPLPSEEGRVTGDKKLEEARAKAAKARAARKAADKAQEAFQALKLKLKQEGKLL